MPPPLFWGNVKGFAERLGGSNWEKDEFSKKRFARII